MVITATDSGWTSSGTWYVRTCTCNPSAQITPPPPLRFKIRRNKENKKIKHMPFGQLDVNWKVWKDDQIT